MPMSFSKMQKIFTRVELGKLHPKLAWQKKLAMTVIIEDNNTESESDAKPTEYALLSSIESFMKQRFKDMIGYLMIKQN